MNRPAVSVIMPVYNTDSFLGEAVSSVLNQTFKELEFIIVNDGSTDNSLKILREFEKSDSRVIVIDQQNSGSSVARQRALELACGEFLYFMDSDDILDNTALELCYNRAVKDSLDMVFFDAVSFSDDPLLNAKDFHYNRKGVVSEETYRGVDIMDLLLDKDLFRVAPWMHFFRRELVVENGIKFYPGIVHEDELFFSQLYFYAVRVGYIPEDLFKRRLRANSTMTASFSLKRINSYFTIVREFEKTLKTMQHLKPVIKKLISNILSGVAYQAGILNFKTRFYVFGFIVGNGYFGYVKPKSMTVLIFPDIIRIKSIIKPANKR